MTRDTINENIKVSIRSIRSQILRTVLTVAIIAFGIMALVSMVTATESLKANIQQEFSTLGTNVFNIKNKQSRGRRMGMVEKEAEVINYRQATAFKEQYDFDAIVSLSAFGSGAATIKYGQEKTNPNVQVIGIDEQYLNVSGFDLESGRSFSASDLESSQNLVILGKDVVTKLFNDFESPIDKEISIGSFKYTVAGVLESKGSGMGMSQDNQCYITLTNLKKQFATANTDYRISVMVNDAERISDGISEAFGVMRVVRGDEIGSDNSFEVDQSSALIETLLEAISVITIVAAGIGVITLFGAGIGLMNIMLVSVTERTQEIGVRKAIGASSKLIRMQFLVEAIIIGQLGGAVGIILGLIVGNIIAIFFETPFVIPWFWIVVGVSLCAVTSVVSGYYPAKRAAALDPIDALRHE
ncbi:MAG: ABC transporter permease [Flavobacteriales bacterium]|jgi:putative ABC transport system permease protein|nr:ABC transporter permease [Flavobacteriales bacterium]